MPKTALKLPQIIAHRGCAGYASENTIESIHVAADMGIKWVELDVKLTKDDVPVLFYDETLERMTNGEGLVADHTYAQLQDLRLRGLFDESYTDLQIPTLEQALDAIIARDLGLNLEINPCPGREVTTAEAALDILSHVWDDHTNLLLSSFSHVSLETCLDMAPEWARGLLLAEEWPENWSDIAQHLDVSALVIPESAAEDQVKAALDYGVQIAAYTVNDAAQAHILQAHGVSCIISDEPDVVQDGLLTVH